MIILYSNKVIVIQSVIGEVGRSRDIVITYISFKLSLQPNS